MPEDSSSLTVIYILKGCARQTAVILSVAAVSNCQNFKDKSFYLDYFIRLKVSAVCASVKCLISHTSSLFIHIMVFFDRLGSTKFEPVLPGLDLNF